ncbi:MAG: ABC transporter ATP-binding protein [Deltaproteobacteria bacterium]|nr:ABC transporter ATP-binding protein [Deltaproteobacteria bacterium]
MTLLEIKEIHSFYGLAHILFGINLRVEKGEIVCLLGRNGAGKSTTLKSVIGLVVPRSGSIQFKGREIRGKLPHQIARMGIGYVPEDRRIYADLTVRENLEVPKSRRNAAVQWTVEKVYSLFPILQKLDKRRAGYLSGGEQQLLAIARALIGNPELLLLDEPTEGLAPILVRTLEELIIALKHEGISILVAEQNVNSAFRIADKAYVISKGKIVFNGSIDELKQSEVIEGYLVV